MMRFNAAMAKFVAVCSLFIACQSNPAQPPSAPVAATTKPTGLAQAAPASKAGAVTLNVGLYPYVPRLDQFKAQISQAWQAAEPNVALNFVDWDGGYSKNPVDVSMDVFVFDAIFLDYFRSQGWLTPLSASQIAGIDDFLPYAISGVQSGGSYYAIPMLGCTDMLFYRKGDAQLASATTLTQVASALGKCSYTSQVPPDVRGLMVDFAGGTTNACFYVDAAAALNGKWPPVLPWSPGDLDPKVVGNLQSLLQMASYYNGTQETQAPYQRGSWFAQGFGRAVVGYTESMSAMGTALANIDFKVLPMSDDPNARRLFYSDVVGINPKTTNAALALELANLMTSTQVMVASTGPVPGNPPQYLMPTRPSIFQAFGQSNPVYLKMQSVVQSANPTLFNLGAQARSWLAQMKAPIQSSVVANYSCGCDQNAGPLYSQQEASQKCPGVCGGYGGWNGQWRTLQPTQSVCGCNSCFTAPTAAK